MVRTNDPKAPPLGSRLLAFCRASPLSRLGSRLRRVAGLGIVRDGFSVCVASGVFYGGFGGAGCYGFGFEWCGQGSRGWRSRTVSRVSGNTTNFFRRILRFVAKKRQKRCFAVVAFS